MHRRDTLRPPSPARPLVNFLLFGVVCYLGLLGLSLYLHYLPFGHALFSQQQIDLLYSNAVVATDRHPLYRPWLLGFVREPGAPAEVVNYVDTYSAYGVPWPDHPMTFGAADAQGWRNTTLLYAAKALFIGDSFCEGAGVGTEGSIPVQFQKATGAPSYAACRGAYGLAHYQRILDRLTDPRSSQERFTGKTVYVLLYIGNDISADLFLDTRRVAELKGTSRTLLSLKPLRNLLRFLVATRQGGKNHDLALAAQRPDAPAPVPTSASSATFSDTRGYYPVSLSCPTEKGRPFAFHPFYRTMVNISWFEPELSRMTREILTRMAAQARERGIDLRVAVLPTSLQALDEKIDPASVDPKSPFYVERPIAVMNMNLLLQYVMKTLDELGLQSLNLLPLLKQRDDICLLYSPMDTHMTAAGYQAVVEELGKRWPEPAAK